MINFRGKSLIRSGLKNRLRRFINQAGIDNPVILIHMQRRLDELSPILTDIIKEGFKPRLICVNSDIPMYFEKLKNEYKDIKLGEDYLDVEALGNIEDFVCKLTTKWHLFDNAEFKRIINYRGIDLGLVLEYDFQLYLLGRVRMLEMLDSVIKKENPTGLAIISDSPEDFFGLERLIKNSYGIRFAAFFIKINRQTHTSAPKRDLKGAIADIVTGAVDFLARKKILTGHRFKNKILVDRRISEDLSKSTSLPGTFLSTPFEKGLRLRISLLKREGHYFPFCFPSNVIRCRNNKNYKKFRHLEAQLFAQEFFKYKNFFIGDIIRPKLKEYFELVFPRLIKNIDLFERFSKRNFLRGVVLRHDLWELQRLCVELCKIHKIPSMVIQHGVFGEKIERIIFADKIAVWGEMCRKIYKSFGNDESKCVVTGNPRHDLLHNYTKPKFDRMEICGQLGLDPAKDIIVLLSAHDLHFNSAYMSRDRYEVIVKHLIKAMDKLVDKQLVIKLHPYEDGVFARDAIKYFDIRNIVVVKDIDLYSLLNASNLVISKESSAGLKALILKKPFITLNFEKRGDVIPYAPSGAALGVYRKEDMLPAIKKVFLNNDLRTRLHEKSMDFIRDYAYAIDGKSSERVVDFIQKITERGK